MAKTENILKHFKRICFKMLFLNLKISMVLGKLSQNMNFEDPVDNEFWA